MGRERPRGPRGSKRTWDAVGQANPFIHCHSRTLLARLASLLMWLPGCCGCCGGCNGAKCCTAAAAAAAAAEWASQSVRRTFPSQPTHTHTETHTSAQYTHTPHPHCHQSRSTACHAVNVFWEQLTALSVPHSPWLPRSLAGSLALSWAFGQLACATQPPSYLHPPTQYHFPAALPALIT